LYARFGIRPSTAPKETAGRHFYLLLGVGVHSSLATRKCGNVDETTVVEDPLLCAALGSLLLLLLVDFGGLRLDFTRTSEGSVDFSHDEECS